jgi:hypothetical protein
MPVKLCLFGDVFEDDAPFEWDPVLAVGTLDVAGHGQIIDKHFCTRGTKGIDNQPVFHLR